MRRPGRLILRTLLAALVLFAIAGAFWFGLVPQRFSPFAAISLDEPNAWFLDPRLAALRRDPVLCKAVLREPHITAAPISDNPIKNGCGWKNSVSISRAGGVELGAGKITCEMAAALALWVEYEVQPLALSMLGSRVTGIADMGTYDCRNIVGNSKWIGWRSQHALANAIDISGFRLEGGQQITVAKDWNGNGREAEFLRAVHERACRYFRVALGPDFNAAHANHFHYDRGILRTCK